MAKAKTPVITLHPTLTNKQRRILEGQHQFAVLEGPAGTSKTYLALAQGLYSVVSGEADQIVIIRSTVETRPMGFLPGGVDEKMSAYAGPYTHILEQLIPKSSLKSKVTVMPTAFLRGMTFDDTFVIIDEFQNMLGHELETVVTRIGEGTSLWLCGDPEQSDLHPGDKYAHEGVLSVLKRMPEVTVHIFTEHDIVRSDFCRRYFEAKRQGP